MKKLLILVLICISLAGKTQDFEYQVLFEGIGDNREYSGNIAYPQTILGSRGAFEVGIISDNQGIRAGLSHLFEFGSDLDFHKPKLTLYYQYSDKQKKFIFGAFPRRGKVDFPLAMLTDTLLYYRPNIEGFFTDINWQWGNQNAFVDWVSRQTDLNREQFMAGTSGKVSYKNLFLENYFLLFHDAAAAIKIPGEHIKDYLGFAIQSGIKTSNDAEFRGNLKAGVLSSFFRERSITDGFITKFSLFLEANGRYKNYAVKSVLNSGNGHSFAHGDHFYRLKNYWRSDVIWYFINHNNVKGRFNLSFHVLDWKEMNQQQQLSVVYIFGK